MGNLTTTISIYRNSARFEDHVTSELCVWIYIYFLYFWLQVKWLEDKLHKITGERDYYRAQFDKLSQQTAAIAAAASRSSNSSLLNGSPNDLHMGGQGGQLDLSLNGAAAAAAAAAAHEDYKRDSVNYQNNNDLKLGPLRWVSNLYERVCEWNC